VASGFNPALIMGIVCFFNAQHHKYQVQELLGLLSKYLEVESKTLRTGPVLQEELRALKFLHKSARVHIKSEQEVKIEKEGEVVIGTKRVEEGKGGERKRAKYTRPFMTTVPLDMSVDPKAEGIKDFSAPIPLPVAHRQNQVSGSSRNFAPDFNFVNDGGILHTQTPYQTYPHVPCVLQYAIKDFSHGDQDLTTYADYSLPIAYPQVQQGNQQFDPSSSNLFPNDMTGINLTPSPNSEAIMWAALGAFTNSGPAYSQVLSNMDTAGAQLGEISPPSSLGDLPGTTNLHIAQGYEGYGYGTSGLGIQLGNTPTPMHAGYHNPVMAHPQPHIYSQQPNQYLQPNSQHMQAMRRQSFPLPQTQTQVQVQGQGMRWSQGMIQNGTLGESIPIPQAHEAVKVARSNSMWEMPGKQP
jgi:hypothetical protein